MRVVAVYRFRAKERIECRSALWSTNSSSSLISGDGNRHTHTYTQTRARLHRGEERERSAMEQPVELVDRTLLLRLLAAAIAIAIGHHCSATTQRQEKLVTFVDSSRHTECETGCARVNKPDRTNTALFPFRPTPPTPPPRRPIHRIPPTDNERTGGRSVGCLVTLRYRSERTLLPLPPTPPSPL